MILELYIDSTVEPFKFPSFDCEKILDLLKKLRERGIEVKIVDTAGWSYEMLYETYLKAASVAIAKGYLAYRVRKIFGSARESGKYFGRQVPALLVYEDNKIVDVYPHEERGRLITIEEFLRTKLRELEGNSDA